MDSHLSDRDLLIEIHTDVKALKEAKQDQEVRIRTLETYKNWLMGAWVVMGSVFGFHIKYGK